MNRLQLHLRGEQAHVRNYPMLNRYPLLAICVHRSGQTTRKRRIEERHIGFGKGFRKGSINISVTHVQRFYAYTSR